MNDKNNDVEYAITRTQINLLIFGIIIGAVIIFAIGIIIGKETGIYENKANHESHESASLPLSNSDETEEYPLSFEDELLKQPPLPAVKEKKKEESDKKEKYPIQSKVKEKKERAIEHDVVTLLKSENFKRKFVVQVAAFKSKDTAETLSNKLRKRGYPSYVARAEIFGKGVLFRVRVGNFDHRNTAEQYASRLRKDEHFLPFITMISEKE
ncbi:MAG: SPOR domain-containing protein [Thermodesulfobacteriota bacterium]|nr:SPOR domain-containing protein [Thermodesulfobacteriota bacterium]